MISSGGPNDGDLMPEEGTGEVVHYDDLGNPDTHLYAMTSGYGRDDLLMRNALHYDSTIGPGPGSNPNGNLAASTTSNNTSSNNPWRELPLHHAAATGAASSELNRLVVHEGYDVDALDASGSTPLHLACYFGHEHCVKWLANRGRARYVRDMDGNTPAEIARQHGHTELADIVEERMTEGAKQMGTRRAFAEEKKEEQLYVELDRLQSKVSQLKASEKRARSELDHEVAERVKLFRTIMQGGSNEDKAQQLNALDLVSDLRIQIIEFKSQRDALSAELKMVEEVISGFELLVGSGGATNNAQQKMQHGNKNDSSDPAARMVTDEYYVSPSTRLKACLRKI